MAKKKTPLERVRSSPRNASVKDLQKLIEGYGFTLREVSGDHYIYKKAGYRPVPIPYCQNPVALYIVKEILKIVDSIEEAAK